MASFWLSPQPPEEETAQPKILGLPAKKFWIILALVLLALVLIAVVVAVLCILLIPSNEDMATEIKDKMNLAADPCVDFHEFACGGWLSSDGVKNSEVPVSLVGSMQDDMKNRILDLLKRPLQQGDPVFKVKPLQFFQACNNVERLKERGKQPFLDFLKEFGNLPIVAVKEEELEKPLLENDDRSNPDERKNFAYLVSKVAPLGSVCFFTVHTYKDYKWKGLYLRQLKHKTDHKSQLAVKEWFRAVLKELGFDPDKADYQSLMHFEDSLVDNQDDNRTDCFIERSLLSSSIDWMDFELFFQDITRGAKQGKISWDSQIIVESLEQFQKSSSLEFLHTSHAKINMPLCILRELLKFTSLLYPGFPQFPLGYHVLGSSLPPNHSREQRCLTETMELLPELVHRLYSEEYKLEESTAPFITDMLNAQKVQFKINAEKSKKEYLTFAQSKIDIVAASVGYPDNIDYLNKIFDEIPTKEYFEAVVSLIRFRFYKDLLSVYGTSDAVIWRWKYPWKHYTRLFNKEIDDFGPSVIDLCFAVPAEILRTPVFDSKWRSSMKFGALGSLLGSRMYKVASKAAEFPLPDNYRECYLPSFNNKSFQNHKFSFRINESSYSSKIDQFLWDTAGMELSCLAYEKFQEGKGDEMPLPGLSLTKTQLFFVSYAQMMCEKIPLNYTAFTLSRPQLPFQFRVNEMLRQIDSFRTAFGCKNDSVMLNCPRY